MDFQSADHGVNVVGMAQYIEDINSIVLTRVSSVIRDTSEIETTIRNGWHGNAPEQFISNINKAKEKIIESLAQLEKTFEVELKGMQSAILEMDATLVGEE